jgi:hypothetical protein
MVDEPGDLFDREVEQVVAELTRSPEISSG